MTKILPLTVNSAKIVKLDAEKKYFFIIILRLRSNHHKHE